MAASLLSLLLIAVVNLVPSSLIAGETASQSNRAGLLAQNAIESAVAKGFGGLPVGPLELADFEVPEPFQLTLLVGPVDGYDVSLLKRIEATVSWTYKGRSRVVRQEMYVDAAQD